jgi:phosphoenolpyruvate-protein phosphotransferase
MIGFTSGSVRLGVRAASKDEAIRQVAGVLAANGCIDPGYAASMLGRERVANTYLGKGIAIPHGLPKDRGLILKTGIAVVQVDGGVEWVPGERARLVVGIAAKSDEHLEILGNLTDLLYHDELVAKLARTRDPEDIVAALTASREESAMPTPGEHPGEFAKVVEVTIAGSHGLHARPATAFVECAKQFDAEVVVRYGTKHANGRSLAGLLKLGVKHGGTIRVSADGPEADAVLAALKKLVEAGEPEEETAAGPSHGWAPRQVGRTVPGVAASPGLAVGPVRLMARKKLVFERSAKDPARERQALRDALASAKAQLSELHASVGHKSGPAAAAIFLAHAEFLADPDLRRQADDRIAAGDSAGWAWQQAIDAEAAALEKLDDPVLAGRAADVRDVGGRVLGVLAGSVDEAAGPAVTEPSILLADDLTPSDAAALDPAVVLGFCTAGGGPTSHVAIIARSLNIPAVVGTGPAVMTVATGSLAVLDGDNGALYVDPGEADVAGARDAQRRMADLRDSEDRHKYEPAITTDGERVEVVANIGAAAEARQAVDAGGEGVGLLRSEFLFLDRESAPTEDEQYAAYSEMARSLAGLPLIVRTLDIGGDKAVPYLDLPKEENPFLGVRGVRLCLARPDLFRTQLRAVYRAAAHGPIKLMFPMIATLADLRDAKVIAEQVRAELGAAPLEIGIMVEVPSAVVMAPELAKEVDFFSVGTNDLTQYVLAMDRGHPLLAKQADGLHPAVLRMIDQTVRAATAAGKWVGVCGGIAGDPLAAAILVGMGVAELSVSIPSIAAVKARVRTLSMTAAKDLARRALACGSANEVRKLSFPTRRAAR